MADQDTGRSLTNDPDYVRRLDRTPEKIVDLPAEDKKLVYTLRSAIEGAHNKMQRLRDEVDQRDREIDKEKALRQSLEEKLEKSRLVEMYGSPEVNDELHERLPRAHLDRKYNGRRNESEVEETITRSVNKEAHGAYRGHDSDTMASVSDSPRKDSRHKGSRRPHKSRHSRSRSAHDSYSDNSYHTPSHNRSHFPAQPPYPIPYGPMPPSALPPHMSYASPPGAGYITAYPFTPPQGMYMPPFLPPTATSTPTQQVTPHQVQGHLNPIQAAGSENIPLAPPGDQSGFVGGNTGAANILPNTAVASLGGATSGQGHKTDGQILSEISNIGDLESVTRKLERGLNSSVDQSRQIASLLKELDAAKDLNKKLSDRLYEAQKELEALKLHEKTKEAEIDERIAGRAGELVEQIYKAQKERDAAVMGRLRLANEERDEALTKLERLQKGLDDSDDTSEVGVESGDMIEVLSKITDTESSGKVRKEGKKLEKHLHTVKGRRQEITAEEMQAILEERDSIIVKAKQLEHELLKYKKAGNTMSSNKEQEKALKAKLMATQQERDMALAKVRRLEDELQNVRVYYSLHKSLSQEASLRDQFNNSLENLEEQLKQRDGYVNLAQKENNQLLAQLKAASEEKAQLLLEVEKARNSQREATENCQKLERLVSVLRRKVSGLGAQDGD